MTLAGEDRLALNDLVHRYAAFVDDRDLAGAAALFTDDGVLGQPRPPKDLDPVHEAVGPADIEQALAQLADIPLTVHAIVGTVFDPDPDGVGDAARGRVACVAHHVSAPDGLDGPVTDLVWHLRYLDAYRRTPSGWRISRRDLHIDLIETRPVRRVRTDRGEQS